MFVSPTVVGGTVLVGSCAGSLYALDRATGNPIWQYDTRRDGAAAQFHGEPLLAGDRVVVPTDADPQGHLYSFNAASGDLLWSIAFDKGVATTPLLAGGRIVVVTVTGEVVAIDARSGRVAWRKTPAGVLKPTPYIPSPAIVGNRLYIADNANTIFALDARRGAKVWQKKLAARPNTAVVAVGSSVVVGTADGALSWLATDSGRVKRRVRLEGRPYGTPIFASPMLFVLAGGASSTLLAIDAGSGAIRWKQETPKEWTTYRPLVAGPNVIAGDDEKNLCAFDPATGAKRWCRAIGQTPRGLGIASDGTLFVGSLSGLVQALRIDAPAPQPH